MNPDTLSLASAIAARDYGIDAISLSHEPFISIMRKVAVTISQRDGQVTSDMLRLLASSWGLMPQHPNAWGAIFKTKGWRMIDRRQSQIVTSHARWIGVWKWEQDNDVANAAGQYTLRPDFSQDWV